MQYAPLAGKLLCLPLASRDATTVAGLQQPLYRDLDLDSLFSPPDVLGLIAWKYVASIVVMRMFPSKQVLQPCDRTAFSLFYVSHDLLRRVWCLPTVSWANWVRLVLHPLRILSTFAHSK